MGKQWQRMHKKDTYYKRAKAEGYRSRAAYKLKEINSKFNIIHKSDVVLDLGAAPGGWSQVAAELVGANGLVIGVDLDRINPIKNFSNVFFLTGDITDAKIVDTITEKMMGRDVNIIISDAAPNISGNYSVDQANSIYLAEAALKLADQLLVPKGNFIVKVFEGEDFKEFIDRVKSKFQKRRIFSPKASRSRSSEVYVMGFDLKK